MQTKNKKIKNLENIIVPVNEIITGIDISNLKSIEEAEEVISQYSKHIGNDLIFGEFTYFSQPFGRSIRSPYAETIYRTLSYDEDVKETLSKFKNQIVVDLGAGGNPNGYQIAQASGAKAYVGVEAYFPYLLRCSISWNFVKKDIPASVVPEDMLTFLKRLPSNSVSLFASGIDCEILPRKDYVHCVEDEIKRCLHPEGAFVADDCCCLRPKGLNSGYFRVLQKYTK